MDLTIRFMDLRWCSSWMGAEPVESLVPGGTGFGVLVWAALRVAETRSVAPTVGCCCGVDGFAAGMPRVLIRLRTTALW
jgi:hypothetical protein